MINVIHGGNDAFDAIAFGRPDPLLQSWSQNRMAEFQTTLLPEAQLYFRNQANTVFQQVDYSNVIRLSRNLTNRESVGWSDSIVVPLLEIEDIQAPPTDMIPYIMADPEIQAMYQRSEISGYDEYYHDSFKTKEVVDYLYGEVINGIYQTIPSTDTMKSTYVVGEYDSSPFDIVDKDSILQTWEMVKYHVSQRGEDPTSMNGAQL